MSAAVDIRGLKRVCVECGVRFYDMNKRPIVCPNCKSEFSNQPKLKGRKLVKDDAIKAKALSKNEALDENEDEIDLANDDLNLDDVAAMEDADDDSDEEDTLGLGDDDLGDIDMDMDDLDDEDLDDLDVIEDEDEN